MTIFMIIIQIEEEKYWLFLMICLQTLWRGKYFKPLSTSRKFQAIIKELFIRCRKLSISLVFITQSYFSVPKDVRLDSAHYLILKINNNRELQSIAINHSTDIGYKDFMKIYRECTKDLFNFLTIDTTLPASDILWFRKNLFDSYVGV